MASTLRSLIGDAANAALAVLGETSTHARAITEMAEQSIHRGIDYATLGLNWNHPRTRTAYRRAEGSSFRASASRARQARSKLAMQALVAALAATPHMAEELIVGAFCEEIGSPSLAANASFQGVLAALDGELLLPLRAFSEGIESMYTTYRGEPVPPQLVQSAVHDLLVATLSNRFSEWRYTNPVGLRQLEGLSAAQVAKWREPTSSIYDMLRIHEDEPGEVRCSRRACVKSCTPMR